MKGASSRQKAKWQNAQSIREKDCLIQQQTPEALPLLLAQQRIINTSRRQSCFYAQDIIRGITSYSNGLS